MQYSSGYIVLLFCVFFLTSCKKNDTTNVPTLIPDNTVDVPNIPIPSLDERSDWQKPDFIIQELGDLNGKVVADIGAGALGYFVFKLIGQTKVKKVIAIDIDKEAIEVLTQLKSALNQEKHQRLDIRLASPDDPKIKDGEADKILIVNTVAYIKDRINYFKNLYKVLPNQGQLMIVDFKTKRIPEDIGAPPYESRAYLHIIEEELYLAGFKNIKTNDTSLEYQYMITASK